MLIKTVLNRVRSVCGGVGCSRMGLAHRDLSSVTAIGVDEVLWHRGHKYLTVVYQIDEHCKRLLWVGKDRTTITFMRFFSWFGQERTGKLKFSVLLGVCVACLGWKIPRPMVYPDNALAHRANEEDGQAIAQPSSADSELV